MDSKPARILCIYLSIHLLVYLLCLKESRPSKKISTRSPASLKKTFHGLFSKCPRPRSRPGIPQHQHQGTYTPYHTAPHFRTAHPCPTSTCSGNGRPCTHTLVNWALCSGHYKSLSTAYLSRTSAFIHIEE